MNMNDITIFDISDIKSMPYDEVAPLFDGKNVAVNLNNSTFKAGVAKVLNCIINLPNGQAKSLEWFALDINGILIRKEKIFSIEILEN